MRRIGAAGSTFQLQWVDNICRAIFSPHANVVEPFLPEVVHGVCVQRLSAPIFQLINFIFTHLFLNVLSDGNATGCSSEVLTWQMDLKGGSEPVSEAGFQFRVEGSFFVYYS